jgi:hypothetical protein
MHLNGRMVCFLPSSRLADDVGRMAGVGGGDNFQNPGVRRIGARIEDEDDDDEEGEFLVRGRPVAIQWAS